MNLDEALAVWLYLRDQPRPTKQQRRAEYEAWLVICREANKVMSRRDQ